MVDSPPVPPPSHSDPNHPIKRSLLIGVKGQNEESNNHETRIKGPHIDVEKMEGFVARMNCSITVLPRGAGG